RIKSAERGPGGAAAALTNATGLKSSRRFLQKMRSGANRCGGRRTRRNSMPITRAPPRANSRTRHGAPLQKAVKFRLAEPCHRPIRQSVMGCVDGEGFPASTTCACALLLNHRRMSLIDTILGRRLASDEAGEQIG